MNVVIQVKMFESGVFTKSYVRGIDEHDGKVETVSYTDDKAEALEFCSVDDRQLLANVADFVSGSKGEIELKVDSVAVVRVELVKSVMSEIRAAVERIDIPRRV